MLRRFQLGIITLAALVATVLSAHGSAYSNTLWVNDDDPNGGLYVPPGTSCNNPGYPTIQAAVTAANPGDRINVCAGTYIEQVAIPATQSNIELRSVGRWDAIIKAPPVMVDPKAIVRVNGAQNVSIIAFTITGPGGTPCDSLRWGVRVDNGGSANILGNHITQIRDTPFSGCQNGVAVLVGRAAEATTGSARIIGNVIDNYQKNGPTVSNSGSYAEIAHNRIFGIGPTAVIAQNGIQVSSEATADVAHNFVSGNIYTPQTFVSTGILLFDPGEVVTSHNSVSSNDVGAYMFMTSAGVIAYNHVRASTFDGIVLDTSTDSQVSQNHSNENGGPGIGAYVSQDNAVHDNLVDGNRDSGILLDDADFNSVAGNKVRDNGNNASSDMTDGIRVNSLSTDNTIENNHLKNNVTHDCHDDSVGPGTSGTGNYWVKNHGETENRPGLCTKDDSDSFATSVGYGWDADYPWYADFGIASEYDWVAAYATIDTNALLEALPEVPRGTIRSAIISPAP